MRTAFTKLTLIIFAFSIVGLSAQTSFAGPAQFVIVNINAPGAGFNDPTPRAPVGGNPGTTLGQQRLFAFEHAAAIWSALRVRCESEKCDGGGSGRGDYLQPTRERRCRTTRNG